jgi:hypothetical protein
LGDRGNSIPFTIANALRGINFVVSIFVGLFSIVTLLIKNVKSSKHYYLWMNGGCPRRKPAAELLSNFLTGKVF